MSKFPYSDLVLEHFKHPRNVGEIEDPDGKATEGSPACGDMVSVYIKVDDDTKTISDVKFQSYGCASNIATGSIITELASSPTPSERRSSRRSSPSGTWWGSRSYSLSRCERTV